MNFGLDHACGQHGADIAQRYYLEDQFKLYAIESRDENVKAFDDLEIGRYSLFVESYSGQD